jgi:hypothetical protein
MLRTSAHPRIESISSCSSCDVCLIFKTAIKWPNAWPMAFFFFFFFFFCYLYLPSFLICDLYIYFVPAVSGFRSPICFMVTFATSANKCHILACYHHRSVTCRTVVTSPTTGIPKGQISNSLSLYRPRFFLFHQQRKP